MSQGRPTQPYSQVRHVFRWDLDKTYLNTDFDSFSSLLRIAFEKADQKVNVPGAAYLLRALSNPLEVLGPVHIYFISGSPRQMHKVLAEKLALDGVTYHDLQLKPNLSNLARGRFRAVKEQVGYKLPLLLRGRRDYLEGTTETLFGDDAENDALIYSLYADYMAGDTTWETVEAVLADCGVYPDALERARAYREELILSDCVQHIFINLDRRSRPSRFSKLNNRIVPVYNYWQAALCLHKAARLDTASLLGLAQNMMTGFDYSVSRLRNSTEDLIRRGKYSVHDLEAAVASLRAHETGEHQPLIKALGSLAKAPPPVQPAPPAGGPRDYRALLHAERTARKSAKAAALEERKDSNRSIWDDDEL